MRSENIKVLVNATGVLFIFRYPTQFVSGVFRASWLISATHRHELSQSGREHLTQFRRKHNICYMSSIFRIMTCGQMLSNRVPVTTAWHVLRLRIEEQPPIRRVAANKLNKQSRTADEGWSSSLRVG